MSPEVYEGFSSASPSARTGASRSTRASSASNRPTWSRPSSRAASPSYHQVRERADIGHPGPGRRGHRGRPQADQGSHRYLDFCAGGHLAQSELEAGRYPSRKLANLATENMRRLPDGGNALWLRALQSDASLSFWLVRRLRRGPCHCRRGRFSVKLDGGWKARIVKAKDTGQSRSGCSYQPVTFADLPGWAQDDHLAAFKTFLKSCERVIANAREKAAADKGPPPPTALVAACGEASRLAGEIKGKDGAPRLLRAALHAERG